MTATLNDQHKAIAPFDFLAHLQRQREWSERTFGPGSRAKGVVEHIRKELCEIEADPADLMEWIDVVILALDGAWRAGGSPQQIIDTIVAKQTKNEGRVWPDWRTMPADKAIEHDRSHDSTAPNAVDAAAALSIAVGKLLTEAGYSSESSIIDSIRDLIRRASDAPATAACAGIDFALNALDEYQRNWDTGAHYTNAQAERIAMECAVEALRGALGDAKTTSVDVQHHVAGPADQAVYDSIAANYFKDAATAAHAGASDDAPERPNSAVAFRWRRHGRDDWQYSTVATLVDADIVRDMLGRGWDAEWLQIAAPTPAATVPLTVEQRDAINEAICWANDDGLPGTADALRSLIIVPTPAAIAPAALTDEQIEEITEAREILENMVQSIELHGNYSTEATCTFLRQALQCLPVATNPSNSADAGEGS